MTWAYICEVRRPKAGIWLFAELALEGVRPRAVTGLGEHDPGPETWPICYSPERKRMKKKRTVVAETKSDLPLLPFL